MDNVQALAKRSRSLKGLAAWLAAPVLGGLLVLSGCQRDAEPGAGTQPAGGAQAVAPTGDIKIGFLVKQPDEPWFQTEWKFAQKAADENHFTLLKQGVPDGERALAAIDNLAAQGAQGFVICTPDPKLGKAILDKAEQDHLKFMTVDDQFVDPNGKVMEDVHHLGMSPHDIGKQAGQLEIVEMKKRGWSMADTAVLKSSYEQLQTAKDRTDGATEALLEGGVPQDKIYNAPNKTTDQPAAYDAANVCLTQHPEVKHWLIIGMNDSAVLGAVRATENRGIAPADVIGIGINGTDCISEFEKDHQTGFFGSMLLSPNKHGHDTTMMVYDWVKNGKEPPKATIIRQATLITRDTYKQVLKDQGLAD